MTYSPPNPNGPAASTSSAPVVQSSDTGTGSLGALNAFVNSASNGAGTMIAEITGVWVGTITFQGSNNGFTTSQNITSIFLGGLAPQSATTTVNGFFSILPQGFTSVRAVMTAYTSGTSTVTLTSSSPSRIMVPIQGNAANLNMTALIQDSAGASITVGQKTKAASLPVTIASDQGALAISSAGIPAALGQTTMSASQPVAIASDQSPLNTMILDLNLIGQAAQTAIINNILPVVAGANGTDLSGYKSALVQIVSTGTAGTFIFEGSNDPVNNYQTITVYNQLVITGTPITTAITATAAQIGYVFPIQFRYYRLRIVSLITGGSIQAQARFTQATWAPSVFQVAQLTSTNLNANVTTVTTVGTVNSVASSQSAIPGIQTDVASAALTTTTTTATFTPTFGSSYSVVIPVTVVTGTTPTLDVQIQESDDTGTNWVPVYDFARITAVGFYRSPVLPLTGNRIRYVQTVTGTTPSFTRAINRLQSSINDYFIFRQFIDRSIVLTTLNSVTPNLTLNGAKNLQVVVNIGTVTTAPALQVEGSDDIGLTWYAIGTPLTAVPSSTVQLVNTIFSPQLARVRVSTAGSVVVAGYVLLKAF